MKFSQVFHSYMIVSGTERGSAYQDRLMSQFFLAQFGDVEMADIRPPHLSNALGVLRDKRITRGGQQVPLQPATLNRHTQFLQRVFQHAVDLGEKVQHFRWKAFLAIEPEQTTTPLTNDEEILALSKMDDSIRSLFQFSLLTGVRLTNAYTMTWDQVDVFRKTISFRGKSKRPGGKAYVIPLTNVVAGLLLHERGHDDEYVFTYEPTRNSHWGYEKGKRYPLTQHVIRRAWEKLETGKRWHDIRHTFGTRLYQDSKDVFLVQRAMNHADIATTQRYVHTDLQDVAAAMNKMNECSSIRQEIEGKEQKRTERKVLQLQRGAQERTRTFTAVKPLAPEGRGFSKFIKGLEPDLDVDK